MIKHLLMPKQLKERTETVAERRSGNQNKKPEEKTITVLQKTKSLWNFCNNSCDFCIWWWVNLLFILGRQKIFELYFLFCSLFSLCDPLIWFRVFLPARLHNHLPEPKCDQDGGGQGGALLSVRRPLGVVQVRTLQIRLKLEVCAVTRFKEDYKWMSQMSNHIFHQENPEFFSFLNALIIYL